MNLLVTARFVLAACRCMIARLLKVLKIRGRITGADVDLPDSNLFLHLLFAVVALFSPAELFGNEPGNGRLPIYEN